jgi:hypothetical protein
VGDGAEAVDAGLDGPGLLRLVGVVSCLPVGAADHVDLPRERVEPGPYAVVEEHGQVATRGVGQAGADQGQRRELLVVELVLVGTQDDGARTDGRAGGPGRFDDRALHGGGFGG